MSESPKKILLLIFLILIGSFVVFFAYPYVKHMELQRNNQEGLSQVSEDASGDAALNISINDKHIHALIADTDEKRELGLGGRSSLAEDAGMFFIFDKADTYAFWMKDMSFPIDIAWISPDYVITDIAPNVLPSTYPNSFYPTQKALYVLEVNSGFFAANHIKVGDMVNIVKK